MVTSLGDALRVTVTPPLGAAEVRSTVHVSVEGGVTLTEPHENPFNPKGVIATVPPLSETVSAEPFGSTEAPLGSVRTEEVSVVELETVSATVATTPPPIVVSLSPYRTQIMAPEAGLQLSVFCAPVAAGPAEAVADEKSLVE
jgi:hypothetical protein